MNNLGQCHRLLGDYPRAIQLFDQVLALAGEIGNRQAKSSALGNLGLCYSTLGQIDRAIELYEQALTLAQETGHQRGEANDLVNLGLCYADLGQTNRAIELYEQALTLTREILGDRQTEAICLTNLGDCYAEFGQWQRAVDHYRQAIEIADTIGSAPMQAEARRNLAQAQLWAGDLPAARQTIETARARTYPPARAGIALLDGVIHLRQGSVTAAEQAFRAAITHTDQRLQHTFDDYGAPDTKALALTGHTLAGPTDHTADAIAAFRAARALTTAAGITARIQRQLDALAPADPTGILNRIRATASERERC